MRKTPASLRSDPRLLWPGLPGRFAPDWVADLNGIQRHTFTNRLEISFYAFAAHCGDNPAWNHCLPLSLRSIAHTEAWGWSYWHFRSTRCYSLLMQHRMQWRVNTSR